VGEGSFAGFSGETLERTHRDTSEGEYSTTVEVSVDTGGKHKMIIKKKRRNET
jgi:hypothetical protein